MKHPRVVSHLEEVVELHESVELVGLSFTHVLGTQVQHKDQIQGDNGDNRNRGPH